MKILLVNNLGFEYGGAEVMVKQLMKGLREEGHEVKLLASDQKSPLPNFADYTFRSFQPDSLERFLFLIINPFAVWKLWRALRTFKPDLVHVHNFSNASPFIFSLLKNVPTALTLHDHTTFDPTRPEDLPTLVPYQKILSQFFITDKKSLRYYGEKMRMFWLRRFSKNIDMVIACSEFYAEIARESKLFTAITLVHNGLELPAFSPITRNDRLLFIGRIDRIKGIDILLRSMPDILREVPQAHLTVVGDGNFNAESRKIATELNIHANVDFLGYQHHSATERLMTESTIVVVPSVWPEAFGLVAVEAMGVGRPVVGSRTGGLSDVIEDKKTGFLVDPSDTKALADAIVILLKDPALCAILGHAGRVLAEKEFSAKTYITNTLLVYKTIV